MLKNFFSLKRRSFLFLLLLFFLLGSTKHEPNLFKVVEPIVINYDYNNLLFFTKETNSLKIASLILKWCKSENVDPILAFALCKNESRFKPYVMAYNKKNKSFDVGLFQLNTRSYPKLTRSQLLNIEKNIELGIKHLKWCLDHSDKNTLKALSFYNAGKWTVENYRMGESTINYMNQIIIYKEEFEKELFQFYSLASK